MDDIETKKLPLPMDEPHLDDIFLHAIENTQQDLLSIKDSLSQLHTLSSQTQKSMALWSDNDDRLRKQALHEILQASHNLFQERLQLQQSHEEMLDSLQTQTSELTHALQTSNTLLSDNLDKARNLQHQQHKANSTLHSHVKMLTWKLAAILLVVSLLSALMGIVAERYWHTSRMSDVQRWEYDYRR